MPWCEPCERFWNPGSLTPGGDCPTCGSEVEASAETAHNRVPWHFWVFITAAAVYLGWRLIQGIVLLF